MLLIVSGPSGVGKSALVETARDRLGVPFVVPYTTRQPRDSERDGRDYWFLDDATFQERIRRGLFVDWDYSLDAYYGSGEEFRQAAENSDLFVVHALARMAIRFRAKFPSTRLLFLGSPERETLRARLVARGYGERQTVLREAHWDEEAAHAPLFDRVVENAAALTAHEIHDLLLEEWTALPSDQASRSD